MEEIIDTDNVYLEMLKEMEERKKAKDDVLNRIRMEERENEIMRIREMEETERMEMKLEEKMRKEMQAKEDICKMMKDNEKRLILITESEEKLKRLDKEMEMKRRELAEEEGRKEATRIRMNEEEDDRRRSATERVVSKMLDAERLRQERLRETENRYDHEEELNVLTALVCGAGSAHQNIFGRVLPETYSTDERHDKVNRWNFLGLAGFDATMRKLERDLLFYQQCP